VATPEPLSGNPGVTGCLTAVPGCARHLLLSTPRNVGGPDRVAGGDVPQYLRCCWCLGGRAISAVLSPVPDGRRTPPTWPGLAPVGRTGTRASAGLRAGLIFRAIPGWRCLLPVPKARVGRAHGRLQPGKAVGWRPYQRPRYRPLFIQDHAERRPFNRQVMVFSLSKMILKNILELLLVILNEWYCFRISP
jgi:hypothetical protein